VKSVVAATVPLSTLVTYSVVTKPWSTAVMSHGPLIGPPAIVLTTFPELSSTSRHPALAVFALPSEVGRLADDHEPAASDRERRGQPDSARARSRQK